MPIGIGVVGLVLNILTAVFVSKFTPKIPKETISLIDNLRKPS